MDLQCGTGTKEGWTMACLRRFQGSQQGDAKGRITMPVAETLINAAAGHKMMSFMDGNAGYNQIFMAPEDVNKTAFKSTGRGRLVRVLGYDLWTEKCRCNVPTCHELHFS